MEVSTGVPQGSVLGPILWNILYDGVLRLELTRDATCIGFADDLALLVGSNDEYALMQDANMCLTQISTWMSSHGLALAPNKTEAIIMKGKRKRDHVSFILDGVRLVPAKTVNYLGIVIDERGTFGAHVEAVTKKAEMKTASLTRLLPNVEGPRSSKRAVLCSAIQNIVLYGAPVWHRAMYVQKHRSKMERVQRKLLMRTVSAYRTTSLMALQVISGTTPIDLVAHERANIYNHKQDERSKTIKRAKESTLLEWQNRWDRETEKAQWTKRLIKNVAQWVNCGHRNMDYCLTQVLTAHGCFRAYAKRFGKDVNDTCIYCGQTDTVEHTFFDCDRWNEVRMTTELSIGRRVTPETLATLMMESSENWELVRNMARKIMNRKEEDERQRQRNTQEPE